MKTNEQIIPFWKVKKVFWYTIILYYNIIPQTNLGTFPISSRKANYKSPQKATLWLRNKTSFLKEILISQKSKTSLYKKDTDSAVSRTKFLTFFILMRKKAQGSRLSTA